MYAHILVPVAIEHGGRGEIALSAAEALLNDDGHITIMNVQEIIPAYIAGYVPEGAVIANRSEIKKNLSDLSLRTKAHVNVAMVNGRAASAIVDYAEEHQVDCIIIASHHPDFTDYFLGSTAAWVARHANCSVHIIR